MRYNLETAQGLEKARSFVNEMARLKVWVEIKRVDETRTLSQNAFFHLLVSFYGSQVGYWPEEAKTVVKREMKDIFAYEKKGEMFLKSSALLTKDEMSQVISRLYIIASDQGIELPLVDNNETRSMMMNEIERTRHI